MDKKIKAGDKGSEIIKRLKSLSNPAGVKEVNKYGIDSEK